MQPPVRHTASEFAMLKLEPLAGAGWGHNVGDLQGNTETVWRH